MSTPSQHNININPNTKTKAPAADKEKPRRPLSAYNLFFRFKRQKILEACKECDIDRNVAESIVNATPGLENVSKDEWELLTETEIEKFRSERIRNELEDKLTPKETDEVKARSHRKAHFKHGLSFLDMTKIISTSWKECDNLSKKIFQDLADDARTIRKQLLADYSKKEQEEADSPVSEKKQDIRLLHAFDIVRPNAIHKSNTSKKERKTCHKESSHPQAAKEGTKELDGSSNNSHQKTIHHTKGTKETHGQRPTRRSSSSAGETEAYSSLYTHQPTIDPSLFAHSSNPYMPRAISTSLFSLPAQGNPFSTTSATDQVKMVQLEAANESMKKMLEKLMAANADLESQKAHLIQLVGQLTAENSTLKRQHAEVPLSVNYRPSSHDMHDRLESISHLERLPNDCVGTQTKKRPRVLANPW